VTARAGSLAVLGLVLLLPGLGACRKRVTREQCDAILDRYAELVVREQMPDASAAEIQNERQRERDEARSDDAFRNCTSEIEPAAHACAMKAKTADELERCLE
jgi:hypothetical protein